MNPKLIGAFGEYTAVRALRSNGYDIFATNYSTRFGEVDIIAFYQGFLCFVEVKTRNENAMFSPADAVDYHKQENIKSVAASYMNKYNYKMTPRYDIFEVYIDENHKVSRCNHIINAF